MQCLLRIRKHLSPGLCEHNTMAAAHKQLGAKLILQLFNLLREGALSDVKHLGCFGKIQSLGDLYKIFQLAQFHLSIFYLSDIR